MRVWWLTAGKFRLLGVMSAELFQLAPAATLTSAADPGTSSSSSGAAQTAAQVNAEWEPTLQLTAWRLAPPLHSQYPWPSRQTISVSVYR